MLQFTFSSYSPEDDDYEGYGYSLCGRLSAVRIVFLYRFVQEVSFFLSFMGKHHIHRDIEVGAKH